MKKILITLFVFGCSYTKQESVSLVQMTGVKRLKEVAREFLVDIGGEEVILSSTVRGLYFQPKVFQKKIVTAYKKWRPLLAHPRNCKLAEMFQINYQGTDLLSLFSLPKTERLQTPPFSALALPSYSLSFELDPKWILTYLAKVVPLLAINYEKGENTTLADEKVVYENAMLGAAWLQKQSGGNICVLGKALGSIPAAYVAAHIPNSSLILEHLLTSSPRTHKELLKKVDGKLLVIESLNSQTILTLPKKALLMHVTGSHFGPYWGDSNPTWYENEKDQLKLLQFLRK